MADAVRRAGTVEARYVDAERQADSEISIEVLAAAAENFGEALPAYFRIVSNHGIGFSYSVDFTSIFGRTPS